MTTEEYESYLKAELKNSDTILSKFPVRETIGKSLLVLMCPNPLYAEDHEAITLLHGYGRDGCQVDCRDEWSREHIDLMLQNGLHLSDLAKKAGIQLFQDTTDKIMHKYEHMVK